MNQLLKLFITVLILMTSGCASYSITEQEMTDYVSDNLSTQQSIDIEGLVKAEIGLKDVDIRIGRADADRISVFANTSALVEVMSGPELALDLAMEFSAIPFYDKDTGEVFIKSVRLEDFDDKSNTLPEAFIPLLKPAVSVVGDVLSKYPVYQLDSNEFEQALLKSTNPNLVIKGNTLVIEL
jgi:hypothetical protein